MVPPVQPATVVLLEGTGKRRRMQYELRQAKSRVFYGDSFAEAFRKAAEWLEGAGVVVVATNIVVTDSGEKCLTITYEPEVTEAELDAAITAINSQIGGKDEL
ncbi:MAG: hypothetical protein DRI26_06625 [Chloroflexi bacterium]|nr:MAG: hypothetical protein DRI26_06625 [Chloroflexota bacterium]